MKLNLRTIVLFAVNALLLIAFAVCALTYHAYAHTLQAQYSAERYRGDNETPYSLVSLFRAPTDAMTYESIHNLRKGIESGLLDASMDASEDENMYTDSFCAVGTITVSSSKTKNAETTLYAIGGDFFTVHPLHLSSGSYISESDLNRDLVVIDRELSWTLFGATDSTGLTLIVGGKDYIIAGVVERNTDRFTQRADDTISAIYMPFAAVYDYDTAVITSYEAIVPDPVEHFGREVIKKVSPGGVIVENTGRFEVERISKLVSSFGSRTIDANGIPFPSWETAARLCEDHLALLLVLMAVFLAFPLVCFVIVLVKGYKALRAKGKRMADRRFA